MGERIGLSDRPATRLDFLKQEAEHLSPDDQYELARFIAPNVGMVLVNEPPHPDCPHELNKREAVGK